MARLLRAAALVSSSGPATAQVAAPAAAGGRRLAEASSFFAPRCFPFSSVPHDHVMKHSSFHPDPGAAVAGTCQDAAAIALQNHLTRLAAPATCTAAGQVSTDNVGYGFGSVINSWLKPFM